MVPPSPGICMLKCSNITVVNKSATTGYRKQLSPSLMQSVKIEDPIWHKIQSTSTQKKTHAACAWKFSVPDHWHQGQLTDINAFAIFAMVMECRKRNRSTLSISPLAYELQGQNGRQQPLGENMNRMTTMTTGILKWLAFAEFLFSQKTRSQTQQCIPAHLLVLLFMRPWSFGSVLQVRLNEIISNPFFQCFRVQKDFCSPFGSSGSSGTTCPLPGCWDRRSLPTSQKWSGLGCTIRSCNSAKKWSQFVHISFNKNIYIGKYCSILYTAAITLS